MKKRKKCLTALCVTAAILLLLYAVLVNVLVSAALVPDFMRKLEAFERITVESYAAQVQTSDIQTNYALSWKETGDWLETLKEEQLATGTAKYQKLSAETADGYTLIAEEFFAEQDSHRWVLLLHGYTGWKEEMYCFAHWYYQQGYHIIVPDLRCQGESEGDFIGMGWTDHYDCSLWIDYILSQDADARIVLHGQSMGAATALMMTGEETLSDKVVAVVSDCAYTDAYSMFEEKIRDWFSLPAFPLVDSACLALRLRGGYDLKKASAIDAVARSSTPTLFIHGEEDDMISVRMSRDLYEAAGCPKELLIIEGAGHAQTQDKDPDTYYGTIEAFLEKYAHLSPGRNSCFGCGEK